MDNWQKQKELYEKMGKFIGSIGSDSDVTIGINQREAYVLMKALEVQEKLENPLLSIPAPERIG